MNPVNDENPHDNLATWKRFDRPPKEALKQIKGGRLSGMTDISPQWRMKAMTEAFGPCGVGWWYTIDGFDRQEMAGEVALLARITLYVKGFEHPIPGLGASMLCVQEKGGMRLNDEAWKMSVTDALSVAMKAIGVGAEVYLGNWDGSKYRNVEPTTALDKAAAQVVAADVRPNAGAGDGMTAERKDAIADTALLLMDRVGQQDDYAIQELVESLSDNEEKLFLWSLLDSRCRSYIKQVMKRAGEKELATQA